MPAKNNQMDDPMLPPDFPEGWRPNPGDVVEGKVVDLDRAYSTYQGSYYPIITIEQADGKQVAVHAFHSVLKNELVKRKPKNGERIRIVYLGKKEHKQQGMNPIEVYKVTSESAFSQDLWDAFEPAKRPGIEEEPPF